MCTEAVCEKPSTPEAPSEAIIVFCVCKYIYAQLSEGLLTALKSC